MCDRCRNDTLVWSHPTDGQVCESCIDRLYCYGCFMHHSICGVRYDYHGTLHCLTCLNILYENDDENDEFLEELNMLL